MSTRDDSERRLAEALRARARGAGRPAPAPRESPQTAIAVRTALLLALLGGGVLGVGLALLSLLVPGLIPTLG